MIRIHLIIFLLFGFISYSTGTPDNKAGQPTIDGITFDNFPKMDGSTSCRHLKIIVDIILTHRTLSPDEKSRADEAGVTLIETPVAMDAFVVNKDNPVKSLTVEQVQQERDGYKTKS